MRASLGDQYEAEMEMGHTGGMEPGRVILAVNDMSMVDFFRMQVGVGRRPLLMAMPPPCQNVAACKC